MWVYGWMSNLIGSVGIKIHLGRNHKSHRIEATLHPVVFYNCLGVYGPEERHSQIYNPIPIRLEALKGNKPP